jgi:osmotically-inducible protein OsmY
VHEGDQGLSDDEELCHRISVYLQALRLPCLRHIEVAVRNGIAIIEGTVGSYYERQVAVACVKRVAGVRIVTDLIVILHDRMPSRALLVGHESTI